MHRRSCRRRTFAGLARGRRETKTWMHGGRRGAHVMVRTFTVPGYDMQMRACPLLVWDGAGREGDGMSTRVSSCESVPPTRHWSGSAAA